MVQTKYNTNQTKPRPLQRVDNLFPNFQMQHIWSMYNTLFVLNTSVGIPFTRGNIWNYAQVWIMLINTNVGRNCAHFYL